MKWGGGSAQEWDWIGPAAHCSELSGLREEALLPAHSLMLQTSPALEKLESSCLAKGAQASAKENDSTP